MAQSAARGRAKEALWYYFKFIAEKAGVCLSMDSYSEITEIVDLIVDAAKEEMREGK
jgi:hypothetical protein